MRKEIQKEVLVKSLKIALAAWIAIMLAGKLGLKYSPTAGIITVLSIQNTRRETLKIAANRGMAFLCALLLAAGSFSILGFTLSAFGIYLLLFALICLNTGWPEAIAMDSVLVTHFLVEKTMEMPLIYNEIGLFCIGTGIGILINMHLRNREEEFQKTVGEVDAQMKGILHRMSIWMVEEDKSDYGSGCFKELSQGIEKARLCAAANYNNTLRNPGYWELDYISMREQQSIVLQGIYENMKQITYLPVQAGKVSQLLSEIQEGYHMDNTVEELLDKLYGLLEEMKQEKLPGSREEFEARAMLFHILKQLEKLLLLKRKFVKKYSKENVGLM